MAFAHAPFYLLRLSKNHTTLLNPQRNSGFYVSALRSHALLSSDPKAATVPIATAIRVTLYVLTP